MARKWSSDSSKPMAKQTVTSLPEIQRWAGVCVGEAKGGKSSTSGLKCRWNMIVEKTEIRIQNRSATLLWHVVHQASSFQFHLWSKKSRNIYSDWLIYSFLFFVVLLTHCDTETQLNQTCLPSWSCPWGCQATGAIPHPQPPIPPVKGKSDSPVVVSCGLQFY